MLRTSAKRKAEKTLKIEMDDEALDCIYGHRSHPRLVARVVSQFGEECTKVLTL